MKSKLYWKINCTRNKLYIYSFIFSPIAVQLSGPFLINTTTDKDNSLSSRDKVTIYLYSCKLTFALAFSSTLRNKQIEENAMPGFLFHFGASAMCPHGGQVSTISTNTRVMVNGQHVATLSDTYLVAGCAFTVPPGKPQPCVKVQWLAPATRVFVNGQPVILQASTGICQSSEQIPQGPPVMTSLQTRVSGI